MLDDVEDKESVNTAEQRSKTMTWFKGDVEPALDQRSQTGRIVIAGTLLAADSLLGTLSRDPDWLCVQFGALDPEGVPISAHYIDAHQYELKKNSFARVGKLKEFYLEYGSTIKTDTVDRKFNIDEIRYIIKERAEFTRVALAVDPAIAEQRGNSQKSPDFFCAAVVGMTDRGRIHILDLFAKIGASPREQIDKIFDLKIKWDCTNVGIETIAYQKALAFLVREEMFRKSKLLGSAAFFEVEEITHGRIDKITRVEGILAPRYSSGYISHQRNFPELETQLDDWPQGKKDAPDVVAMAIMLLQPYAALAFEPDEDESGAVIDRLAKDQYEALEMATEPENAMMNYKGLI
jgi:hypothetical protein